jgi:hypothetical protein
MLVGCEKMKSVNLNEDESNLNILDQGKIENFSKLESYLLLDESGSLGQIQGIKYETLP